MAPGMEPYDQLLRSGARRLTGHQRRLLQAEVATCLCGGSARAAERRFGWHRTAVATGLHETRSGLRCRENLAARACPPCEVKDPQLAADIRAIVEPYTHADPELKSPRRYTNLSAAEVRQALQDRYGYPADRLPSERTLRDVLNRLGYRRKRFQKAKPLKKLPETDAIFANVVAARQRYAHDPEALEVSLDTKAKVKEGDYPRGGKMPYRRAGAGAEGVGPCPAGPAAVDAVGPAGPGHGGAAAGVHRVGGQQ